MSESEGGSYGCDAADAKQHEKKYNIKRFSWDISSEITLKKSSCSTQQRLDVMQVKKENRIIQHQGEYFTYLAGGTIQHGLSPASIS